jgi:hypothetical protein
MEDKGEFLEFFSCRPTAAKLSYDQKLRYSGFSSIGTYQSFVENGRSSHTVCSSIRAVYLSNH